MGTTTVRDENKEDGSDDEQIQKINDKLRPLFPNTVFAVVISANPAAVVIVVVAVAVAVVAVVDAVLFIISAVAA